jgi:outer membrane protein assembly factor BamB
MFQQGAQHAGQAASAGPSSANVAWTYAPNDGYAPVGSPPIVGPDGTVYVARVNGFVLSCPSGQSSVVDAVSPEGKLIWEWGDTCGVIFRSGMAVAADGTVFAIDDSALIAIAPGGTTRWRTPINSEGEVTIGPDGTLYVQDAGSTLYAVNPTNGQVLWTYSPPSGSGEVRGTAALSPDGSTLYVGSGGGVLSALTAVGTLKWTFQITGPSSGIIENAPAVGLDGTIYVATFGTSGNTASDIDAVNPDGTLKWKYTADGGFETTPAVGSDGLIVVGDDVGTVAAVRAVDGSPAWTFSSPGTLGSNGFYNSSALIDTNGTAYLQNQVGVFAIGPGGTTQWTASQLAGYGSSLALDPASGHLYVVTSSGLVALSSYTKTISGTYSSPLTITAGQSVLIAPGATVRASVSVQSGGTLDVEGAKISGPLGSTGASAIRVCKATITASTTLTNGGPVVVGDDDGSCAGNKLTGPVNITGNTAGVEFDGNTVSGPLTITGNTGTLQPPDFGTVDATNNTVSGPVNIPH